MAMTKREFYEILMNQPEEAKDIALSLELFVNGSLNIFNHQTNVDVDNRFTVYGIRDLGTELSPITMLVMRESIQNRIIANGKRGVATWLYIDEFHVLLNSEYSAKYLQQLWKKVRSLYWHHAECRGSVAELHSDNHACKLRVCCPVKAGKYGQLKNGRGHRCIRSTAPLRNQYPERHGTDEVWKCGNTF